MRYACLIYFDPRKVFDQSAESGAILAEVGPHNQKLEAAGQLVTTQALQLPETARTVRVRGGKLSAVDGPFMESKEVLGGISVIEARDLDEAVRIAAGDPFARVGAVEVRPLVDFSKPRPRL